MLDLLVSSTKLRIFVFCFLVEVCERSFELGMKVVGVGFDFCDVEVQFSCFVSALGEDLQVGKMKRRKEKTCGGNGHL